MYPNAAEKLKRYTYEMRHIIAHLIRGEAAQYHESITKELAEKFDCFPIHQRIQPHLTLKRWFDIEPDDMDALYHALTTFTNTRKQSDYTLGGYGNFGPDVIYVKVTPSIEMATITLELMKVLHTIPNLAFDEFDNGTDFHATVAMKALKPFDFDQIWNFLQASPQPSFSMKFDNIAVLKKEVDRWVADKVWEIGL